MHCFVFILAAGRHFAPDILAFLHVLNSVSSHFSIPRLRYKFDLRGLGKREIGYAFYKHS